MTFRTTVYVDGYNLYYGLKNKGWKHCYWLDIKALAESLLRPDQCLAEVKYYTAMIRPTPQDPLKYKRHATYVEALQETGGVEVIKGHYLEKTRRCHACGAVWQDFEEKMTDVNIASDLLADAYKDKYDTALLISADSDLYRPISTVRRDFPKKRVLVIFPPGRRSKQLDEIAHATYILGQQKLEKAQFPDRIAKRDGYTITRPSNWIRTAGQAPDREI
jgi:uncharacterized LabA/DUF88 family protein